MFKQSNTALSDRSTGTAVEIADKVLFNLAFDIVSGMQVVTPAYLTV